MSRMTRYDSMRAQCARAGDAKEDFHTAKAHSTSGNSFGTEVSKELAWRMLVEFEIKKCGEEGVSYKCTVVLGKIDLYSWSF